MNTNTQSVTLAQASVPPTTPEQETDRKSQGLYENSRRERMRQGGGRGRWQRRGEERERQA